MTIDRTLRKMQMQEALVSFHIDVGDRNVLDVVLRPDSDDYRGMWPATTWHSLQEDMLLERDGGPGPPFQLTTFGWYTGWSIRGGLKLVGERERLTRLVQAMKLQIDGRRDYEAKASRSPRWQPRQACR